MANSWPPTPSTGFTQFDGTNVTSIIWGTDGLYGTAIVKKMKFSQRTEVIDIENGTGIEAAVILLVKGEQVEITLVADTALNGPPVSGDVVTITTPYTASLKFLVLNSDVEASRKAENEYVFMAKSYVGIPNV